jgi:zinc protease
VKAPADLPVVMMAYKVPVIRDVEQDVDPYALEMLAAVLAGHEAARFSRHLVREQRLAVEAGQLRLDRARSGDLLPVRFAKRREDACRTRSRSARRNRCRAGEGVSADELRGPRRN